MIPKKICSEKHFHSLLKSFKKISILQMQRNVHIQRYEDLIFSFITATSITTELTPFDYLLKELEKVYKNKPYKTHSCFTDEMFSTYINKFFVSYTFENSNGKRIFDKDYSDSYIVFRIYLRFGQFKKKRIAKWSIKVDW